MPALPIPPGLIVASLDSVELLNPLLPLETFGPATAFLCACISNVCLGYCLIESLNFVFNPCLALENSSDNLRVSLL